MFNFLRKTTHTQKTFGQNFSEKKSSAISSAQIFQETIFYNPLKPVWMSRDYARFASEGYQINVIAHRSINMVSKAISSIKWQLQDAKSDQAKLVDQHPILTLLAKPNGDCNGKAFLEEMSSYRQISGNAYVLVIKDGKGKPVELYNLRPDRVSIETDKQGNKVGYIYNINNKKHLFPVDRISGDCDVLHLKNFNPLDDYFGLSSIEPAAYSIDQHNQASKWNQSLLQNGARPSGALVVKAGKDGAYGQLTDEQFLRLKEQFSDQYAGSDNSGKPLLLEGGLDWKEMSISPKDMDFLESKNNAAREIALAFGVPPQLLGIPGDNTYSNLAEARVAFWEQTVIPAMDELCCALDNWLVNKYPHSEALTLRYDKNDISALLPRKEKQWERVSNADFLSDEEKREILGVGN